MRRQLAQSRPSDTNAVSVLNSSNPWEVDLIVITNSSAVNAGATIYHDADGTTYDESTAIGWALSVKPNDVVHYELSKPIANTNGNGNLAVKTGVASALTFTVYGTIQGERV